MINNKKIFIILLNYNSYKDTLECVDSIEKKEKNINYEIIVVDNNSSDGSIKELSNDNRFIFIETNENGGFAKGNNVGIKYAMEHDADYIMLLNNDTIIENNSISKLVEKLQEDDELGIIGSRIMYYSNPDIINYCGGHINWFKVSTNHENYKKIFIADEENFKYTEFITGCCMLIKREVIQKIGLLPEEYFMYYEDMDFCIKAKEADYKLGILTDSVIYHKVSISSGGENSAFSIKWGNRNRLIIMDKYSKYTKGILSKIIYYSTRILLWIKYIIIGEKKKAQAIIDGIVEGKRYLKTQHMLFNERRQ